VVKGSGLASLETAKNYEIVTLLTYTPSGGGTGWVVLIKNKNKK
jgi:hypothetical protein|tara:strand:- start:378 stop:509 length:132 start_codon:yes stop_codon:yes gene_type:complete